MFGGCVSEAVVEMLVDGGDLFLLGGLKAKGCSKWFELEGGFIHLLGEGGLESDTDTHTDTNTETDTDTNTETHGDTDTHKREREGGKREGWEGGEKGERREEREGREERGEVGDRDRDRDRRRDRQRQTDRLESKRPRVNGDVRNCRLTKGSHMTSEVWEKRHSEGLGRQERDHERRLCIRSLLRLRSHLLCCACPLRMTLLGPGRLTVRR